MPFYKSFFFDGEFKSADTKTSSKNKVSFKKLTLGTKYYIKVRAYYDKNDTRTVGKWSKVKAITIS